ncbi:hypothetical protein Tco_1113023 [Tanacetum coccineum]|uniref:Retrotransposon gag domain-containing protein n=1 Tax=Tanacetum coccineum TaxID=301880 RepID=A0ABQ5IR03_9ASTR
MSSNKELVKPYAEPEQVLHSLRKLFKTTSFDHSSSPEFELFSDHERQFKEEITKTMTEPTMEESFLKELREHTVSGSENEDANKHIERVLDIVDLFTTPDVTQDQLMLRVFLITLTRATSRWLRNEHAGSITTWEILKGIFLANTIHLLVLSKSSNTSDGLAAIQAQLNNLSREIKKVNEREYVAQVGCELCNGLHYTKDFPLKDEGKTLKEAYYTQFGVPFPQAGRYRAATLGFYQRDNGNMSYQERRQMMEESLNKFMAESAKRHDEHSYLIKEIRASTDAAIRN